jgi:leader peptidase (prepilin peptidase)/N-methyltransferase
LVPLLLVGLLGVLLGAIDLAAERLPDVLVLPGLVAAAVALAVIAALTGAWGSWGRALVAGLAYAGTYLLLALLPGGQLGLGDVKLAALLGMCLGWFGWPLVVVAILLPWLVNAPVALVLLVRRGGGSMPFGPAMLVGAYLSLVLVLPWLHGAHTPW